MLAERIDSARTIGSASDGSGFETDGAPTATATGSAATTTDGLFSTRLAAGGSIDSVESGRTKLGTAGAEEFEGCSTTGAVLAVGAGSGTGIDAGVEFGVGVATRGCEEKSRVERVSFDSTLG